MKKINNTKLFLVTGKELHLLPLLSTHAPLCLLSAVVFLCANVCRLLWLQKTKKTSLFSSSAGLSIKTQRVGKEKKRNQTSKCIAATFLSVRVAQRNVVIRGAQVGARSPRCQQLGPRCASAAHSRTVWAQKTKQRSSFLI